MTLPNKHGESGCDRCGRKHSVVWVTDSDLWNAVMRDGDRGNQDKYGFCCMDCFVYLAESHHVVNTSGWRLSPIPRVEGD